MKRQGIELGAKTSVLIASGSCGFSVAGESAVFLVAVSVADPNVVTFLSLHMHHLLVHGNFDWSVRKVQIHVYLTLFGVSIDQFGIAGRLSFDHRPNRPEARVRGAYKRDGDSRWPSLEGHTRASQAERTIWCRANL